ncbi:FAD-binding and (Fe-S)-binding domain-containing protein [Cellulomonas soli]|uniref:D-lactate dehydrogenase (cytochrome) n=1 Tax=Cellulomonas soli TaxID=931535 RepID=A0A512PGM2_9CELL|nr:FAD-binding and (Fe-S)-binding domain-containing protein [Cellulomonas soli]NYI58215.1 D-lactate dehydrogenase [Cellulomonas soli]GEP70347.1 oxidoreductase [Cellulomonas soli]
MTATATTPDTLADLLGGCVADRAQVRTDELTLRALAHDASHVLLVPSAVVAPRDADEVARLLRATAAAGVPLTFRSGGTSLSGQAGGSGVLADVRRHFTRVDVLDEGARVRVQPGVTVRHLNARLARYGRRFGPDPASEAACTVGGVVADNSSGMASGTVENSYRTLESLVAVLPSGTVVDTGAADADERLQALEPALHAGLLALRRRVLDDPASTATVARQFAMKNTMGYGLNALVDFASVPQILAHLLVGSEGTLAFVASATFRTVPVRARTASALLVFDDLYAANRALPALVATGAATLELMDATSLRVGQQLAGSPAVVRALSVTQQAALLLEYQATTDEELDAVVGSARPALDALALRAPVHLSADATVRGELWKLRKGLYTAVAGARRSGTTALLEDVVVPVDRLADTCATLTTLFATYGYDDAVIFGHAKDGNIHFMLTDRFETGEQLARYRGFTEDLVDLVLGHGGSLKAEHGTGRVMAPFVRRQYGDELYDVMRQVKHLFDPRGLLNPGVLLDDDPDAHLRHIKLAPTVQAEVDRCVECGYCEPVCPSRDLTLTPRQRIALRRDIRTAELAGDSATADRLEAAFTYPGTHTCAVDGMCGTACPVGINTGLLVKTLRRENLPVPAALAWTTAAKGWGATTALARTALTVVDSVPGPLTPAVTAVNAAARAVLGSDTVPLWSAELPRGGAPRRRPRPTAAPDAVYLPACVNVMFGPASGGTGVQVAFEDLCAAAGLTLLVPEGIDALCCGTPWSSKGVAAGYAAMREKVLPVLRQATDGGRLPVVSDASSCTEGFRHLVEHDPELDVQVVDVVTFVAERVLPALGERAGAYRRLDSLTLHPTCSSTQLGLDPALATVAEAVAETVTVPLDWGCCAFAGDRGLLHPELTASATRREAAEVARIDAQAHASCNRTCELGMTRATGRSYRHVVELLAEQALGGAPPDPR